MKNIQAKQGYWRVAWASDNITFERCPYPKDCIGVPEETENSRESNSSSTIENVNVTEGCLEGTKGPMCSICLEGYNRDTTVCQICENGAVPLRVAIVVTIIFLMILLVVACKRKIQKKWIKYKPLWRDVLRVGSINITFLQINSSLPSVIEVEWPEEWNQFVRNFNFVNIDVLSLVGINCIGDFNYYISFCMMICLPIGILFLALINYKVSMGIADRKLLKMTPEQSILKEKEALHLLFDLADSDHSDQIDPSELMGILRQLGWSMKLKTAVILSEKIGAVCDGHGHLELTEEKFLNAMITGKIAHELDEMSGVKVLSRSRSHAKKSKVSGGGGGSGSGGSGIKRSKTGTSATALTDSNDLVKWTIHRNIVSNSLSGATQLLLLAHTPVSRKVFQFFHCNTISGKTLLIADYDIDCLGTGYFAFMPVVLVVLAVYTAALPMTILFYLFRHRDELYSTSVNQRIGWLYDPYVRGAEFWQVHDVLMKMVLTGMLIYIPSASRAGIAALLCMVAIANLNFFEPHKNKVLFWLSQISFMTTGSKYVVALLLTVDTSIEEVETIGTLLICLDIGFIVASIVSIVISIWMLRNKFKTIQKKNNTSNAPTKVIPVSNDENQEKDQKQGKSTKDIKKDNTDVNLNNSIGYDDWNDEGESIVQVVKIQKENPTKKELLVKSRRNTIHFGDEIIEEKETEDNQVENDRVVKEEMMRQEEEIKQKELQMVKEKELLMLQVEQEKNAKEKNAKEKELQNKTKDEEKKKRKEAHVEKKKQKDEQVNDILLQRKNSTTRTRSKIKF